LNAQIKWPAERQGVVATRTVWQLLYQRRGCTMRLLVGNCSKLKLDCCLWSSTAVHFGWDRSVPPLARKRQVSSRLYFGPFFGFTAHTSLIDKQNRRRTFTASVWRVPQGPFRHARQGLPLVWVCQWVPAVEAREAQKAPAWAGPRAGESCEPGEGAAPPETWPAKAADRPWTPLKQASTGLSSQ
jgi:hypothetical protein